MEEGDKDSHRYFALACSAIVSTEIMVNLRDMFSFAHLIKGINDGGAAAEHLQASGSRLKYLPQK